jgi:hypothetical protein
MAALGSIHGDYASGLAAPDEKPTAGQVHDSMRALSYGLVPNGKPSACFRVTPKLRRTCSLSLRHAARVRILASGRLQVDVPSNIEPGALLGLAGVADAILVGVFLLRVEKHQDSCRHRSG